MSGRCTRKEVMEETMHGKVCRGLLHSFYTILSTIHTVLQWSVFGVEEQFSLEFIFKEGVATGKSLAGCSVD